MTRRPVALAAKALGFLLIVALAVGAVASSGASRQTGGYDTTTKPIVKLSAAKQTIKSVVRKGAKVRVRVNVAQKVKVTASAKGKKVGSKSKSFTGKGKKTVRIRLAKKARRAFRKSNRVKLKLRAVGRNNAGRDSDTLTLKLK